MYAGVGSFRRRWSAGAFGDEKPTLRCGLTAVNVGAEVQAPGMEPLQRACHMSRAGFIVSFDGPGVEDGRIDVRDLAPALLSLGRMIDAANVATSGEKRPIKVEVRAGVFAGNPQNIDGSASDIVFYPILRGLMWVLEKLGFRHVRKLVPPPEAYQQLATGKRIMVEARY